MPLLEKLLEGRWSRKRGGAKGGAPSYIRRTDARLALLAGLASRLRWSPLLVHGLVHALSSCGSAPPVVQLVLWFMRSWSCERPGRWRRGLEAQLCRLCGAA